MKKLFGYFGHHKCATQWINAILVASCNQMGLRFETFHNPEQFEYDLKKTIRKNKIEFLSYINADYKHLNGIIDHIKGFHVIRDPRDLFVSSYFSHLFSHPTDDWEELKEHRQVLQKSERDQGLLLEMEFTKGVVLDHMNNWNYNNPNILEVKMEDLIISPYRKMLEIFEFLDLIEDEEKSDKAINKLNVFKRNAPKISPYLLLGIIYNNRFSKKAKGRDQGHEDVKSHYRKGIAGDWKNHFNKNHIEYFKDNFNDSLLKFGYEKNADW